MAKENIKEYERDYRLDHRLACIDRFGFINVTNRAFLDYFGKNALRLIDVVVDADSENLMSFIESFDGNKKSELFRFYNSAHEERQNVVILQSYADGNKKMAINIEMIDIESVLQVNAYLGNDVEKFRALLGITDEYTFLYNRLDNRISIYRYNEGSREALYKLDIDEWHNDMINNGYVLKKDEAMFNSLINEIKSYPHKLSLKINASFRTRKEVTETLRVSGILVKDENGDRVLVGRIMSEATAKQHSQMTAMLDEMTNDPLTGVYNKKTIQEYTERLITENNDNVITLVIMDVDHFKNVNDTYGHIFGDKVLTRVGRKLKEIVGEDGVVGRIGGDEFMIVFHNIDDEQLLRGMLRAIRTQIKWEFAGDFDDFMVTASLGAAVYPSNGKSYDELFKKADFCLYVAKEKGRDRYVFYRSDIHEDAYQASLKKASSKNNGSNSREMKELHFIANAMSGFSKDKKKTVKNMLKHMYESFNLDNLSVYYGDDMAKSYNLGLELPESAHALYVSSSDFKDNLNDNNILIMDRTDLMLGSGEFLASMKKQGVSSTLQCLIGSENSIEGLLTLSKIGTTGGKWAEYEIESAAVVASLLTFMEEYNMTI